MRPMSVDILRNSASAGSQQRGVFKSEGYSTASDENTLIKLN
ncbi:MAG: hypothetical protein K7J15_01335 [Candidatus Regiella insecticola]|nr:hypothetical protein [Candidatus Regiella insecticola]